MLDLPSVALLLLLNITLTLLIMEIINSIIINREFNKYKYSLSESSKLNGGKNRCIKK